MERTTKKRKTDKELPANSNIKKKRIQTDDDEVFSAGTGRAGRIVRIYLRNFMCHDSLCINFNSNINFVIGRNGSGKSAILTALIIGLGGRANLTNRGNSVKGLIQVGKNSCSIEITLSNNGPMGYQQNVFGKQVTICRTFSASGTSSYKLKSENGTVISQSFKEVKRVVDSLNIQIDNPICILNQDVARTFLNTTDTMKKYAMFMKATNLENVRLQIEVSVKNEMNSSSLLSEKNKLLLQLEEEVKKWYKKYENLQSVNSLEEKKENLDLECVWAQLNMIQSKVEKRKEEYEEAEQEFKKLEDSDKNKDILKQTLKDSKQEIENKLKDIKNEEEQNKALLNEVKTALKKLTDTKKTKDIEMNAALEVIRRKEEDQKQLTETINEQSEVSNKQHIIQEQQDKLKELEVRGAELSKMLETSENDRMQCQNALSQKSKVVQNLRSEYEEINGNMRRKQSQIQSIKGQANNSVSVYGGEMPRLLEAINTSKEQFVQMPRGPIGSYIQLKNKKWVIAIEEFISPGILKSFCVDNHKDSQTLSKIFNKIYGNYRKPTVICSKFFHQVHDVSKFKTEIPNSCIALIDMMQISDPVVTNCLIDQLSVESVLLLPHSEMAYKLMSNAKYVPRNCLRALTLNGDQFYPDPNYRSYACRNKGAKYLQVSTADVIRQYEEELTSLRSSCNRVRNEEIAVKKDVGKLSDEIKEIQQKISKFQKGQYLIRKQIDELRVQELPVVTTVEILVEEMNQISSIIDSKKEAVEKFMAEIQELNEQIKNKESEIDKFRNLSKALAEKMQPLITDFNEIDGKLKKFEINTRYLKDRIKQSKQIRDEAKTNYERENNILQKKTEETKNLGEPIATERSVETILNELDQLKQTLAEIKSELGDKLVVARTYQALLEKYEKTNGLLSSIEDCLEKMHDTNSKRSKRYKQVQKSITVSTKEMFSGVLKIRQFKGSLEIDHNAKSLELIVMPQHGSQGSGQTNTLSGGERSYSTVAFLHALWQVMEYPFYILDEFDVFMDKVNRRTVMDLLIEHAKEHPDLQFVFLTPQDISNVVADSQVTIHRMSDPIRRKRKISSS